MISLSVLNQPSVKTQILKHSDSSYTLIVSPLLPGFGYTIGNSIRRVMLSSIPGFAVTKVRINDITHEYQPIKGVVEDALDVILNLKLLKCKIKTDDEKITIKLSKNSSGEVLAGDFDTAGKGEVVNPDLFICNLNDDSQLDIELEISRGVGYLSVDDIDLADNTDPQNIYVDGVFSPVSNVALDVKQIRVGDRTNFDELSINFETDTSINAEEIVKFVLDTQVDLFSRILSSLSSSVDQKEVEEETKTKKDGSDETPKNNIINLPARIKNILDKNGITTNEELVENISTIKDLAGISEKSFATIQEYIKTIS